MKVKIQIDTQTFIRFWLVAIGFAAIILGLYFARTGLIMVATAAFLALALNKPVNFLSKYMPGRNRVGGSALAFLLVVAVLGALVFLVVPPIIQQTNTFIAAAPERFQKLSQDWHFMGEFVEKYKLQPQVDQFVESLKNQSASMAQGIGQNILSSVGSFANSVGIVIVTLVVTFFMLIEGPVWIKRFWSLYEDKPKMKEHRELVNKMAGAVSGYVNGQITISAIGAVFAGLTVFILSLIFPEVPANLAMPVIAISFVLVMVPMFGSTLAGVLSALLLMLNSIPAGIIFGIYFLLYQQIENNFVAPTIQSKYLDLSPLTVLIAVTIGVYMGGLAGGIISIPIAGMVKVYLEYFMSDKQKEARNRKKENKTGVVSKLKNLASK